MAERARCGHPKPDGSPCKAWPKRGKAKCASHLGLAGRRPKLGTDAGEALQAQVVALLRNGNYIETSCRASGLSVSTYYGWVERGEADVEAELDTPYAQFSQACARARAEGEAVLVQEVRAASRGTERQPGDWKAAAWMLERTLPDKYGQKREVKHDVSTARTEPPEVVETEERLLTVAQLMTEIGVMPDA